MFGDLSLDKLPFKSNSEKYLKDDRPMIFKWYEFKRFLIIIKWTINWKFSEKSLKKKVKML
jgi:hypothetical protein